TRPRARWSSSRSSSTRRFSVASSPPSATPSSMVRSAPASTNSKTRSDVEHPPRSCRMAELTINTADIASALKKNLSDFKPDMSYSQVGRILEVGDGIARVSGLPDAAVNELLEFEDGTLGLALNLDEESIGAVVLGESNEIEEGQAVKATGRILSVPVGDGVLGRVLNGLGEP